jgi:predicted metal-binding membrane protein
LLSAAMMLPTALPALATFDDLPSTQGDFGRLVGGYLAVWLVFSAVAAVAQMGLWQLGLVDQTGLSVNTWLSGGLLILAGAYQFSAFKAACVSKCRAPFAFFMQHWPEGPWRMGLRLGAVCLGCCWALMLLAFVGGVMSLAFMGLATLLMVFEKLPQIGERLTLPLGLALIGAGLVTVILG